MTNFADLVLGADTRGLLKGVDALGATEKAAGNAQKAVTGTEKGFTKAGQGAQTAGRKLGGFNVDAGRTQAVALAATRALAGMAAAFGVAASAGAAIGQAREYGSALSEVSTLIEGTAAQTEYLDQMSRQLAATYGGTGTAQAQAFYQAISAGAASVEDAGETLDAANRLAIGGVTDVTTAVGVLSTAMNVYGESGLTAAEASDAIFVAVKAGVTTVGELSSALGNVLPLAETLGLTFDETAAATAALTKGGLSTAQAVTGLRASLTSILGPSKEASDLAAQLGIDFSSAGLEAQGFGAFMAEVVAKTDGNAEAMQTLFGSVEAVGTALAFSGTAGTSYGEILDDMADKAGATTDAFNTMSEDMQQRLNVVMGQLWDMSVSFGQTLLTALVPTLEAVAFTLGAVADNADVLLIGLGVLTATYLPAIYAGAVAAVGGLTSMAGAVGILTAAINLIPGVALFAGITVALTGITRGFRDSKLAAAEFQAAMDGVLGVQNALNTATTAYYNEISRANLEAMLTAAETARDQVELALEAARAELEAASFATNFFGASLGETERMTAARAAIGELSTALVDAESKLSFAENAAHNFEARVIDVTTASDGAANSLSRMGGEILSMADQEFLLGEQMQAAADAIFYAESGARLLSEGVSASVVQALQLAGIDLAGPIDPAVIQAAELAVQLGVSVERGYGIASAVNSINFSSAVSGAQALSAQLGVSLQQAMQMMGLLGAAAQAAGDGVVYDPRDPRYNADAAAAGARLERVQSIMDNIEYNVPELPSISTGGSGGGGGGAASSINATTSAIQDQISALEDAADPMRKYNRGMAELDALKLEGLSDGAYAQGVADLTEELQRAQSEASGFTSQLVDLAEAGADAFGDWVASGFKDFKGMIDGILSSFKSMLSQMISTAIANPIKLALGIGGTAGATGGLGGGIQGLLGNALGGFGGSGGLLGAFTGGGGLAAGFGSLGGGTGLLGGLGNTLAGTFGTGGGIGGLFSSIGGGAGIMSSIGAALPIAGIALAAVSFFKKKTKLLDEGIRATIGMENAMFESFQKIQTKRFWGLSKKTSINYKKISASPFLGAINPVRDSVAAAAQSLNVASRAFNGFSYRFSLSLSGLSEEAKAEKISQALSGFGDALASRVPYLRRFTQDGEGAFDTLMRLASTLGPVNDAFRDLGFTLYDVSVLGAGGAAVFADLFGGLENFTSTTAAYYDQFYSDQEKLTNLTSRVTEGLASLGVNFLPETNAAFRELVDTAEMAGDMDLVAGLIQLAPAFDTVTDATNSLTTSLAELSEQSFSNAFDYRRAVGRAANGIAYSPQTGLTASDNSNAVSREEFAGMKSVLERIADEVTRGADASEDAVIVAGASL